MTQEKEKYFKKSLVSGAGLLIFLVVLISLNVLFSRVSLRWDATEEKSYSLSQGTIQIISDLPGKVTIKLFYSASQPKLPIYVKTHAKRVRELLREYEYESNGLIEVLTCDPKPDSNQEEWADIYGIEAKALQTGERVYFGLIAYFRDREEVIPFLDYSREELLEYDLTRMIAQLGATKKKTIGILSALPIMGQPKAPGMPKVPGASEQSWFFVQELKQNYEVVEVNAATAKIDAKVDMLIVVHPKGLREETLYAIDRFIISGKNAIILVDPVCRADVYGQRARGGNASTLEKLFSAWGIEMDPAKAVVDLDQPTKVLNRFNVEEESPAWVTVRDKCLNDDDVITSRLEEVFFPWTGVVRKLDNFNSNMEFEPIVTTSNNSALMDAYEVTLGARTIKQDFVSGKEKLAIAVKISGKFPTAYPDGPPEEIKDKLSQKDIKAMDDKNPRASTVLVIADVDLISDDICVIMMRTFFGMARPMPRNDNLSLFANACEVLTGSKALISIRSKGKIKRPFTKVLELRNQAQASLLAEEKALMEKADAARKKLAELEKKKDDNQRFIMSPEQRDEIDSFEEQQKEIERDLKLVRKNLRSDIEALGWFLKFINILLMPIIVAFVGIGYGIYRYTGKRVS